MADSKDSVNALHSSPEPETQYPNHSLTRRLSVREHFQTNFNMNLNPIPDEPRHVISNNVAF